MSLKDIGGILTGFGTIATLFGGNKAPETPSIPNAPELKTGAPPVPKSDTTMGGTLSTGTAGVMGTAPTQKKALLGQ